MWLSYPMYLELANRKCVVVGGGRVAQRKVEGLLSTGAQILLVSPEARRELEELAEEDVLRWDHGGRTYIIVHGADGEFYCTDGLCTHEHVHLADGLVMDYVIECPKHNGQFDYRTGEAKRAPACEALNTYATKVEGGRVWIEL